MRWRYRLLAVAVFNLSYWLFELLKVIREVWR